MKKNYWLAGLLALGMMAFNSCDEIGGLGTGSGTGSGEGTGGDPDLGGKMEELAPNAQKTRLQEVGLEFINNVKAGDHENLVDVAAYIEENLEYDIDEDYVEKIESLYEETYEGDGEYDSPVAAVRSLMAISLDAAKSGAQLSTRATNVWTTTLKAGMPDVYGRFTPNKENEEWEWDSNVTDRLEVAFTDDHNQSWVATLKGSKETTRVKLTARYKWDCVDNYVDGPDAGTSSTESNDDSYEYLVDVPKEITFVVKCNGNSVIDLTLNSSMAFEGSYNSDGEDIYQNYWHEWTYGGYWTGHYNEYGEWVDEWVEEYIEGRYYHGDDYEYKYAYTFEVDYENLNVDAKLKVNAYEETFMTEITKQGVEASATVAINGQSMLEAGVTLKANMDNIIKQIENAANEEDEDDITINANDLQDFSMYVDVLGKVQIVGKCNKFEDLYDALLDLEEADDEEDFDKYERNLKQVNKAYNITLHYDNTETVQANFELEAYEESDEWDSSSTWFEVLPVIVFAADDSRYSFEDYFTESSFSDLIEEAEDLADDFEDMFDRYF